MMHLLLIYDFFLHVSVCLALYTNQKTSQEEKLIYSEQYSLAISVANTELEDPGRVFSLKSPSDYSIFFSNYLGVSDHWTAKC